MHPISLFALAGYGTIVSAAWPPAPDQFVAGATTQNCPLAGQLFPPPTNPESSAALSAAHASLTSQLDAALTSGAVLPLNITINDTFFSIGVFSADATLFDYHYAVPGQENATAEGKVDSDTVYRIGSISKLLTVYTLLVERGDVDWNQPITKFIPELSDSTDDDDEDELGKVRWEDITVGALASQMAGIARDYAWPDHATNFTEVPLLKSLLGVNSSAIQPDDIAPCALPVQGATELTLCTREEFFHGLNKLGPYFPAFESPVYSNAGFRLLGHVIENITGEAFHETFQRNLIDSLQLNSTSITAPEDETHAVIPGNKLSAQWGISLGDEDPAGGFYSSLSDLTAIGRSILKSSLLSPAQTRRWLKPHSRTSDDNAAIGAPWEISSFRIPLTANDTTTTRIDIYAKSGALGRYQSFIALDPDRQWGFVVLGASPSPAVPVYYVGDVVSRIYGPAFEAAAREEAAANYAGTFVAPDGNSTLTLALQPDRPGVGVVQWTSNGVDVLKDAPVPRAKPADGRSLSVRLYPARQRTRNKVAFRALFESLPSSTLGGPMESACITWFTADSVQIADRMLDDVVIGVDEETGRAEWVEFRAWRMRYERV
ncbi:Beta-lactamase-related protein [Lasiodiplodia theobromae]|uniref:Beta-lactamase-like protein n=1 Tax=Lasiodiplodia theobromae TaxID=45133 RepID=A0A5N5DJW6_9PEZI|nr:Beta-lactamase [Lasiodiplodia theobromae]KAB2577880.1 Beta-lactamase-like protein [Lasiodiplodia theobromae]KAF4538392.1 Beta-lactamase [Lasiodiplodia theobromae]KAF9633493.1 Beta-lactamase-related protein [Lasiodiplodia theobromae]